MNTGSSRQSAIIRLLCAMVMVGIVVGFSSPVLAQTTTDVQVSIIDPSDILTNEDESLLVTNTKQIGLPPEVKRVVYITFDKNTDNLNIDVKNYAFDQDNSLLSSENKNKFESGLLMAAVGFDPQRVGLYCGDAVCQALNIFEGRHLDASIDAMKPGLRRGNYAIGLLDGIEASTDLSLGTSPTRTEDSGPTFSPEWFFQGITLFIGSIWAIILITFVASRRSAAKRAYIHLRDTLGDIATELDEVDIRANSLSSPLANEKLRSEWKEVLDNFLAIRKTTKLVESWGLDEPSFWTLIRHSSKLAKADKRVTELQTAISNINELFEMEQGDANIRQKKLIELQWDISEAVAASSDELSRSDLNEMKNKVLELESAVKDPDFMTMYARVIGEYQSVLSGIAQREYGEKAMSQDDAPSIYDHDWRVGMGYNNWVPYVVMHTHYTSNAYNSGSSGHSSSWGSSNTSFGSGFGGSGSFSGGGGSSSW
ncbi:DUF5129 domain-containing protein [Stomatohabitans albus]|uniref:DUF5129 domain-containing protein n=1 Tax=Stomatohabitans albus TaxID=3110766 RepID=UPI00300D0423